MPRRFCTAHTAILTGRMRGQGVDDVRIAAKLGLVGEPGPDEYCPFCARGVSNAVVREMGDIVGDRMQRGAGLNQVAAKGDRDRPGPQ